MNILNDNLISVSHSKEDDFIEVMGNTNVAIAAYTTCHARLHLYSFIEQLGDRVLYFDTGTKEKMKLFSRVHFFSFCLR